METLTSRQRILDAYALHLRENGHPPASIFRFTRDLEISEKDFFQEFPSFDAVEAEYWGGLVSQVAAAVESGAEWESFTARQRMLTFFFAWFEHTLEVRSLVLLRFAHLGVMKNPDWLRGFNREFRDFTKRVISHGLASGEIAQRGKLSHLYPDALLTAFRSLIDFNLKDDSRGYERTDAFIEKTTALAFELIRTQAIDSAFDLARFLVPQMRR